MQAKYRGAVIKDDPVTQSNKRGTVVFATSGKDSRTTQASVRFCRLFWLFSFSAGDEQYCQDVRRF